MLEFQNVSKSYWTGKQRKVILDRASFRVELGKSLGILAKNGTGKTTLLRTLAGLYQQYDGEFALPSLLYQGHRLALRELDSVVENLIWYAQLEGRSVTEKALRRALAKVGLLRHGLTPVGRLSQGQQRRASMARWLLGEQALWLLDEPLTALDIEGQTLLATLLEEHIARGNWVIYSSHMPLPIADKVILTMQAVQ